MSFKRWFATGLLVIVALSFAASAGVMIVLREREQNLRLIAEEALLKAREANRQLESTLASQKGKAAQLEREVFTLGRMNQLTLVRLKGLEKKMNRLQKELARERSEKQVLAKERSALNNALSLALSDKRSLNTQLNKMFAHAPEEVDLGQIVVAATPPLRGKILVVNDKFQFVVVNLGVEHELNAGTLLNVYRGDQFIGRVQVEQVRESVAACKILPEWTLKNIQEDDDVKEL